MAHCCLLFVGTQQQLQDIYDDCPDSSADPSSFQAFGADWINENDKYRGSGEFTKLTKETKGEHHLNYEDAINGNWTYCFDIRDRHHYGDFGWVNCPEKMKEAYTLSAEKENKKIVCEELKQLPDDQVFFFANSHY